MALPFLILSAASREAVFATNTGGYRPGGAHRPVAAALSLAIAGGIGATLMLALVIPEVIDDDPPTSEWINIPVPADPPVDTKPLVEQPVRDRTVTMAETRFDPLPDNNDFVFETGPLDVGDVTVDPGLGNGGGVFRPVDPQPAPLFRSATRNSRYADRFQPTYPPAMERQEIEGRCPVSVTISALGRVTAVRDNGCANESFFNATQRQAMNNWRFNPATRDGVAIESTQDIAVKFEIRE